MLKDAGVGDVQTKFDEFHTDVWGDLALLTFMTEQSYTQDGARRNIVAPVSLLFRRMKDQWLICLVHAVGIPEAS